MPEIGKDCHIILSHADIDSGAGYGFLIAADGSIRSEGVQFKREVVSESTDFTDPTTGTRLWVYFDVLLSDRSTNPDGSPRNRTRAADYASLLDFLARTEGINITTAVGTLLNFGSVGWSADERHLPHASLVKVNLNNIGYYFPPADPELVSLSVWDGTLTWDTSYWR